MNAVTLWKSGKWSVEDANGHIRTSDGWVTDYPVYYPHNGAVSFDFPERLPKRVKAAATRIMREKHEGNR
jgi:hypothetical protein